MKNFLPQSYPMWAVEEGGEDVLVVIGWAQCDDTDPDAWYPIAVGMGVEGFAAEPDMSAAVFVDKRYADGRCSHNRMVNSVERAKREARDPSTPVS